MSPPELEFDLRTQRAAILWQLMPAVLGLWVGVAIAVYAMAGLLLAPGWWAESSHQIAGYAVLVVILVIVAGMTALSGWILGKPRGLEISSEGIALRVSHSRRRSLRWDDPLFWVQVDDMRGLANPPRYFSRAGITGTVRFKQGILAHVSTQCVDAVLSAAASHGLQLDQKMVDEKTKFPALQTTITR